MHEIKVTESGIIGIFSPEEKEGICNKLTGAYLITKTKAILEKIDNLIKLFDNSDEEVKFTYEQLGDLIAILAAS